MPIVAPICSSSKGNSTYIGSRTAGVLVDCGCSCKALCDGLSRCGLSIDFVKAIVLTHEHIDHVKGLKVLLKKRDIPVYGSEGTLSSLVRDGLIESSSDLRLVSELSEIPLEFGVSAFRTPHDSAESVGYRIVIDDYKIGFCTDLGNVTETVRENLKGSSFVFLEANYEPSMLRLNYKYPPYLKKRIASENGHLSNPDSAAYIRELIEEGTSRIVLGHLSQENNTPETAYRNVADKATAHGIRVGVDFTLDVAPVMTEGKCFVI